MTLSELNNFSFNLCGFTSIEILPFFFLDSVAQTKYSYLYTPDAATWCSVPYPFYFLWIYIYKHKLNIYNNNLLIIRFHISHGSWFVAAVHLARIQNLLKSDLFVQFSCAFCSLIVREMPFSLSIHVFLIKLTARSNIKCEHKYTRVYLLLSFFIRLSRWSCCCCLALILSFLWCDIRRLKHYFSPLCGAQWVNAPTLWTSEMATRSFN